MGKLEFFFFISEFRVIVHVICDIYTNISHAGKKWCNNLIVHIHQSHCTYTSISLYVYIVMLLML